MGDGRPPPGETEVRACDPASAPRDSSCFTKIRVPGGPQEPEITATPAISQFRS